MKILILNGSPRIEGNTMAMIKAFHKGANEAGHEVKTFDVCHMDINGCMGCEYCHTKGNGKCIQDDDMQEIYPYVEEAEMIVLGSPIYYFNISGQLQSAISRTYNKGIPKKLNKAALILSSGSDNVYEAAIYSYNLGFINYMELEDMGIYTAYGSQNKSKEKLEELYNLGNNL